MDGKVFKITKRMNILPDLASEWDPTSTTEAGTDLGDRRVRCGDHGCTVKESCESESNVRAINS